MQFATLGVSQLVPFYGLNKPKTSYQRWAICRSSVRDFFSQIKVNFYFKLIFTLHPLFFRFIEISLYPYSLSLERKAKY